MAAMFGTPSLSRSTEDYLKAIYEAADQDGSAQTGSISEALGVAPSSVSGMVGRLSESGLLEHVPYRGVWLTEAGRRAALRIIRRHRILETYLASKLGYDWDTVHEEVERLQHGVSEQLTERMAMVLADPRYDPHGAPIPSKDGYVEQLDLVPLGDMPVGEMGELRLVSDRDPGLLRYLGSLGLRLRVVFEVVARQPFRGPITIRIRGSVMKERVVGHQLALLLGCAVLGHDVG